MNILVISGSARRDSFNTTLARLVGEVRADDEVHLVADLAGLPFYDGDLEAFGTPAPVAALREQVAVAALLVVVTPEYNGTMPGLLGNAVDWLSRPARASVLLGKPVVVLSASPTRHGGIRAAHHLRGVLRHIGASVQPYGMSVAGAAHRLLRSRPDPTIQAELAEVLKHATEHLGAGREAA